MPQNRLAGETSPYLQQHAHNPVDWYPWGEEALAKAKKENKPILLSIGYSSCHWCHVMEKESFNDPETAVIMNQNFINIKVDREERPDLDSIYMEAAQAMTGQGGWPLTAFLTPNLKPFYAGTYFPPVDKGELPAFRKVLRSVARTFKENRPEVERSAQSVQKILGARLTPYSDEKLDSTTLDNAFFQITYSYDKANGGFGRAPKFPQSSVLELLIRLSRQPDMEYGLRIVENTLAKMAGGGIFDQLGGGFHRYTVDSKWLVPHFEKMLYDNAQLSLVYLHAYQVTRNPVYRQIVEDTLDYVIREMCSPAGGFYSSQDADVDGEEGTYYLWTRREVEDLLGSRDGEIFCKFFGISESGNFEGKNILNIPSDPNEVSASLGITVEELEKVIADCRRMLREARDKRTKPRRDEKILASWNGLMLKSFAEAARVLKRPDYRRIAEENALFIIQNMFLGRQLFHSWKDGETRVKGLLEDHAFLADGLLNLYQTTFDPKWFQEASSITELILSRFQGEDGMLYDTPEEYEALITRPRAVFDYSTPSGGSTATRVLIALYKYTDDNRLREAAERSVKSLGVLIEQQPMTLCGWLIALDSLLHSSVEVALVGDAASEDFNRMLSVVQEAYRPYVLAAVQPLGKDYSDKVPLLKDRPPAEGKTIAYLCRNNVCLEPATDPETLKEVLDEATEVKREDIKK
jgi:uncharacterized protein